MNSDPGARRPPTDFGRLRRRQRDGLDKTMKYSFLFNSCPERGYRYKQNATILRQEQDRHQRTEASPVATTILPLIDFPHKRHYKQPPSSSTLSSSSLSHSGLRAHSSAGGRLSPLVFFFRLADVCELRVLSLYVSGCWAFHQERIPFE